VAGAGGDVDGVCVHRGDGAAGAAQQRCAHLSLQRWGKASKDGRSAFGDTAVMDVVGGGATLSLSQ